MKRFTIGWSDGDVEYVDAYDFTWDGRKMTFLDEDGEAVKSINTYNVESLESEDH